MRKAICYGEVLWDVFPEGKVAGGAPMNVAMRLNALGLPSRVISKIGNDVAGRELLETMQNNNLTATYVTIDPNFPTGEAVVSTKDDGELIYEIKHPAAWDKIELSEEMLDLVKKADIFLFGSLALRDEVSRNTLLSLLKVANYKVFDVNIRRPYFNIDLVFELMKQADFIKLNEEELLYVCKALGSEADALEFNILFLSDMTETADICITRGGNGAVLLTGENLYAHSGFEVDVVDTIGAGDCFLSALLSKFFDADNYEDVLEFASAAGALASTKKRTINKCEIEDIVALIQG